MMETLNDGHMHLFNSCYQSSPVLRSFLFLVKPEPEIVIHALMYWFIQPVFVYLQFVHVPFAFLHFPSVSLRKTNETKLTDLFSQR